MRPVPSLWQARGSFVTAERQRITNELSQLVMAECSLAPWTKDKQRLQV
jgi:hypothetical protein